MEEVEVGFGTMSCEAIEADLRESRREAEQQLVQIRTMATAVDRFVEILRAELGSDSLTVEAVGAMTPLRVDVRRAQVAYLQLADAGIT
ncbi:MAG: hypothetical protein GWN02_02265, partial [Gemmatimonadetes bacterium]|nr:hypothetical protein [Gemmatimonadota bacterium]